MLFSVIVPIYQVEAYLERCVGSILRQTYGDFEVLLVDDGSPDRCPAICDAFAARDHRVRVIHKPNGGLVSARNAGLAAARGDYICYVDADDWVKPELLAFVKGIIDQAPAPVDIVCFGAERVYSGYTTPLGNHVEPGYYGKARLEKQIYPHLYSDRRNGFTKNYMIPCNAWNKVMRRELLLAHYVRDERIRMFEDGAYTYECILYADLVYFCSEPLYCYNKHNPNAMTEETRLYLQQNQVYVMEYLQKRVGGYSPDIARQLSDLAALYILWDINKQLEITKSVFKAAVRIRDSLRATGMLRFVKIKELPARSRVTLLLLKAGMYLPVTALKALDLKTKGAPDDASR